MGHPVTTNPIIIMIINMTVVFLVLNALGFIIKFIHYIDPTKEKTEKTPVKAAAVKEVPEAETAGKAAETAEDGVPAEVVAAITAAVVSLGYSANEIRAIRPRTSIGWKNSGRTAMPRRRR